MRSIVAFAAKIVITASISIFAFLNFVDVPLDNIHNIADFRLLSNEEVHDMKEEAYSTGYNAGINEAYSSTPVRTSSSNYTQTIQTQNEVTWAKVYFTEYGECYHINPNCSSLKRSNNIYEASLEDLYNNGSTLRPCKLCTPQD